MLDLGDAGSFVSLSSFITVKVNFQGLFYLFLLHDERYFEPPRINTLRYSSKFNRAGKDAKDAKSFFIALRVVIRDVRAERAQLDFEPPR